VPACPKPEPRARTVNRRRRQDYAVLAKVRAAVFARDGGCRASTVPPGCFGRLTLAHLPPFRRSQTRGLHPESRHCPIGLVCLCARHHEMEERHQMTAVYLTESMANGPILWDVRLSVNGERTP
jgi:hypothetical protein